MFHLDYLCEKVVSNDNKTRGLMKEKILVIHPDDICSLNRDDFKIIYEGKGYDVVEDVEISDKELRAQINTHDAIVLFWSGGADGLIVWGNDGKPRHLIDDTHVDLLRGKRLLSIGGKEFFQRHGLSGFHTDTIILSGFEACLYDIGDYSDEDVAESLMPLMLAIRDAMELENFVEMKEVIHERYNA